MIKTTKIIELPVDDDMRRQAYSEADKEAGSKILANELKHIGQEMIKKWMTDNSVELKDFEVVTKQFFYPPKSNWDCHLPEECNSDLIFVGIHEFWETGWILGYMKKEEFVKTDSKTIKILNLHDIRDLIKQP